jgi:PAS domain-containing protein
LAKIAVDEIELRRAKRQAEEKVSLLRMATQMAGFGDWRMDLRAGKTTWSDKTYRIYGVEPHTVEPGLKHIMSLCEPEERRKLQAAVEAAVVNKTGYEVQLQIRWPNGEIRHVIPKCVCELDAEGNPVALVGVVRDVTERVRNLKALEEHAHRADLAEEVAGLGHWRMEAGTRKISWSPQMYAIYGLDPGQPLDLQALIKMMPPEDWAARAKALDRLMTSGQAPEQQIIRLYRADGELPRNSDPTDRWSPRSAAWWTSPIL